MKTWFCLTSWYMDNGRTGAAITARKEAERMPESSRKSTASRDIYTDWYGSLDEAQDAAKEVLSISASPEPFTEI